MLPILNQHPTAALAITYVLYCAAKSFPDPSVHKFDGALWIYNTIQLVLSRVPAAYLPKI